MQVEDLDDLATKEFRFSVKGASYLLTEATEGDVMKYRRELARVMGSNKEATAGLGVEMAAADLMLVSLCLYRLKEDGQPFTSPVGIAVAESLSSRLIKRLSKKVEEMSELGEFDPDFIRRKAEDKAKADAPKNEQSAGPATSA